MKKIFQIFILLMICCTTKSLAQNNIIIGDVSGCPGDEVSIPVFIDDIGPNGLGLFELHLRFSNEWGSADNYFLNFQNIDPILINDMSTIYNNNVCHLVFPAGPNPNPPCLGNFPLHVLDIVIQIPQNATGCISINDNFSSLIDCNFNILPKSFDGGTVCVDCPDDCCEPYSWDDDMVVTLVEDQLTICYPVREDCDNPYQYNFRVLNNTTGVYEVNSTGFDDCLTTTIDTCADYILYGGFNGNCDGGFVSNTGTFQIEASECPEPCCEDAAIQFTHLGCGTVEVCVVNCDADEYTFTHPETNEQITTTESCFTFYDLTNGFPVFSVTISSEGCPPITVTGSCEVDDEGCEPCCEDAAIQFTHFECGTVEVCIINCEADVYIFTDPITNNQITTTESCFTFTDLPSGLTQFSVTATSANCEGVTVSGGCEVVNDCGDCCAPPAPDEVDFFPIGNNTIRICFPESSCDDPRYIIHWVEQCGELPPNGIINSDPSNCKDFTYNPCCQYSFEVGYSNLEGCEGANVQWSVTFNFDPPELCDDRIPDDGGGGLGLAENDQNLIEQESRSNLDNSLDDNNISNTSSINPLALIAIPNPFKTDFQIHFDSEKAESYELAIYDIDGKELLRLDGNLVKGKNQISIDQLNEIPSGIYFYQLNTPSNRYSNKVLKY